VAAPFRVLAIDGGGIRGIIPATVLADLERRIAPRAVADAFDLIVGTSTGGILALGLTAPDGGRPRHAAARLLALYQEEAGTIFPGGGPPTLTQRVFGTRDPGVWFEDPVARLVQQSGERKAQSSKSRYPLAGLERVLTEYLGDAPLADAVTDVVVTSYDMANHEPVMFSSRERDGFVTDVSMLVAARATSAGPTYFDPQVVSDGERERVLVDGGVYVNNPSVVGYLLGGQAADEAGRPLVLVSLGTGTRPPADPSAAAELKSGDSLMFARSLVEAVATGSGAMGHALLTGIANRESLAYWRLQTTVGTCSFAMDDSTPENVECLSARGADLVAERGDDLDAIAAAVSV
jgi:predicted acylesterase/phospholipase RssA